MNHAITSITFALGLGLLACGGSSAQWDPESTASLQTQSASLLKNLDSGNFDEMLRTVDDDSIVLDLDENNQPVRFQGRAKVMEYFRHLEAGAKSQGLKFTSTIGRNDCSATTTMGYCVVEFDQRISAGGQTMGPFKFRATAVYRKVGADWRWTHWHGSLRETPAAAPAPSAAK